MKLQLPSTIFTYGNGNTDFLSFLWAVMMKGKHTGKCIFLYKIAYLLHKMPKSTNQFNCVDGPKHEQWLFYLRIWTIKWVVACFLISQYCCACSILCEHYFWNERDTRLEPYYTNYREQREENRSLCCLKARNLTWTFITAVPHASKFTRKKIISSIPNRNGRTKQTHTRQQMQSLLFIFFGNKICMKEIASLSLAHTISKSCTAQTQNLMLAVNLSKGHFLPVDRKVQIVPN